MVAAAVRRAYAAVLRRRIARQLSRIERADVMDPLQRAQARVWLTRAHSLQQRLSSLQGAMR
jgi:hypothetical protein